MAGALVLSIVHLFVVLRYPFNLNCTDTNVAAEAEDSRTGAAYQSRLELLPYSSYGNT